MPAGHAPFALLNRTANQAVSLLLRSPLHPLASGQLALITVTGRRSGREHTLPVGYRRRDDVVWIGVGWPERKVWWRNLEDGGRVRVLVAGRERSGEARLRRAGERVAVEVQLDPV